MSDPSAGPGWLWIPLLRRVHVTARVTTEPSRQVSYRATQLRHNGCATDTSSCWAHYTTYTLMKGTGKSHTLKTRDGRRLRI